MEWRKREEKGGRGKKEGIRSKGKGAKFKKRKTLLTAGSSGMDSDGLWNFEIKLAHARPNTTKSSKELAPSLLAPCTDAHADSPAAHNPGTTSSFPSFNVNTCETKGARKEHASVTQWNQSKGTTRRWTRLKSPFSSFYLGDRGGHQFR